MYARVLAIWVGKMARSDYGKYNGGGRYDKAAAKRTDRKEYARTLRNRQNYAIENSVYRRKIEAVNGRGGVSVDMYRLPADKKKKGKDYFFVMRKFVCFLMFLLLLVSVAYFALGYVKIEAIPEQYTALFIETEAKADDDADAVEDDAEADNADLAVIFAADEETAAEGEEEEEGEESTFDGTVYGVLDPIFGALKYWGGKLNMDIKLGDSPMYDALIAKYEVGMTDSIAGYVILVFPLALILYVIIALVMAIKAFIGMFGRRIVKCFGLGSILMLLFAGVTALGALAFRTDVTESMDFASIVDVLIGVFNGAGGFTGGYGLLILLGIPVLVLILSMFARKKVPYSIFDTFGE